MTRALTTGDRMVAHAQEYKRLENIIEDLNERLEVARNYKCLERMHRSAVADMSKHCDIPPQTYQPSEWKGQNA